MLLRDGPSGRLEVLMLLRSKDLAFVGGSYVFPGGSLDEADLDLARSTLVGGVDRLAAAMDDEPRAAGLAVAAVREAFEEAGLLIGARIQLDPIAARTLRTALLAGECSFSEVVAAAGGLDLGSLRYVAHWVTPAGSPRRFDTRFFLAPAPIDEVASPDNGEATAVRWLEPAEALAAHETGTLPMVPPTAANLAFLAECSSVADALERAARLGPIPRIEPRLWRDGDTVRIALPGEPAYERESTTLAPGEAIPLLPPQP